MCKKLNIRGRIIVAKEGINGTLEGTSVNTQQYVDEMNAHPLFGAIHWKRSEGTGDAFPRLSVKVRSEIVSLHLGEEHDIDPNQLTGKRLSPDELDALYTNNEEFYVVDMRNDYELEVGKFKQTIFPDLENFRDLRKMVSKIQHLKDKKVVTVCTGGVRCEKASGFLVREGFSDVSQLDGGIVSYMKKYPGKAWEGSLYTFDSRITMHFDQPDQHTVIGVCRDCSKPSERYGNCAYPWCNRHMIICESCSTHRVYCSVVCKIKNTVRRILKQNTSKAEKASSN